MSGDQFQEAQLHLRSAESTRYGKRVRSTRGADFHFVHLCQVTAAKKAAEATRPVRVAGLRLQGGRSGCGSEYRIRMMTMAPANNARGARAPSSTGSDPAAFLDTARAFSTPRAHGTFRSSIRSKVWARDLPASSARSRTGAQAAGYAARSDAYAKATCGINVHVRRVRIRILAEQAHGARLPLAADSRTVCRGRWSAGCSTFNYSLSAPD
jgi:hypothetical protein